MRRETTFGKFRTQEHQQVIWSTVFPVAVSVDYDFVGGQPASELSAGNMPGKVHHPVRDRGHAVQAGQWMFGQKELQVAVGWVGLDAQQGGVDVEKVL